jgi:hypothetical protein
MEELQDLLENENSKSPGVSNIIEIAYKKDFAAEIPLPNTDLKIQEADLVFKPGKGWKKIEAVSGSVKIDDDGEGDPGELENKTVVTGRYAGITDESLAYVKKLYNKGVILKIKDCKSKMIRLVGTECDPCFLTQTKISTGEKGGKKGWEFTFECNNGDIAPILVPDLGSGSGS